MTTSVALEPVRWSGRRWAYTIAAVLLVQVGLVIYLGEREQPATPHTRFRTAVHLAVDPWSAEQISRTPTLTDPTLFALPNLNGFSSEAWLQFEPMHHQLTDWTESPRWLSLESQELGQTFLDYMREHPYHPGSFTDTPGARISAAEVFVPTLPLPEKSRLRLTGELADRQLLTRIELRSWPYPNVLSNTVVKLLVNAEGFTVSTTLLRSSGFREADQFALGQAGAARFEPLPRRAEGPLMWGNMVFEWHTTAPSLTNRVSEVP